MVVVAETEWETWSRLVWSSGSPIPVNLTLVTSVTSNAPKAKNEKHQSVIKTWRVNITYQHCKEPWTQTHSEWRWGKGLWPRRPRAGGLHHPGLRHPRCLPKKNFDTSSATFLSEALTILRRLWDLILSQRLEGYQATWGLCTLGPALE